MTYIRKCLIIDDDQDDQEIFLMCLKAVNGDIDCLALSDPTEAVALLKSSDYTPDYIFLDVNMPKLNGIDCLRLIKNIERLQYSKIYIYSTTSEGNAREQSREIGADDFIVKPAKTSELKDKLATIFNLVCKFKQNNPSLTNDTRI